MTTDSIPQKTKEQPSKLVRRFLSSHKSPLTVLILSPMVGVLAGLLCTFFDIAIDWVTDLRQDWLSGRDIDCMTVIIVMASSALLSAFGFLLVNRIAPETAGSGIPEIEGALDGVRPVRWWRVIPVKFFGGVGTIGVGLVLGREGPSVQMGGKSIYSQLLQRSLAKQKEKEAQAADEVERAQVSSDIPK
ncbi:MAG: chloride channel protein [Shewanella sp.]|nr:chloride channel protein [Shewanella sp.]MCF1430358.1 chloride channel protein [Shewanella sp.]MCF1439140.1 chloride channel protein [Shewanella sp.]MCF1459333.1 chloride channel protein [Shewanella sp.]